MAGLRARGLTMLRLVTALATALVTLLASATLFPHASLANERPSPRTWMTEVTQSNPMFRPFRVSLSVTYRGIKAGKSILTLERLEGNLWRYRSSNRARGLFRLVFPEDISQYSEILIEQDGIRPQRYVADDGTTDTSRDIELIFDWSQGTIRGSAEQQPVFLTMDEEVVLDPMSVQLALMRDLALGRSPDHYWLADKTQLKRYVYRFEEQTTLQIAGKSLTTVVWSSQREGSDRVTRVWHAKELGFMPVKAERRRGDRMEWSMLAETYDWDTSQVSGKVTPR